MTATHRFFQYAITVAVRKWLAFDEARRYRRSAPWGVS
jgi:hypothetical protein